MDNPFSHLDDIKLMELYKNGESMAFDIIYSRYHTKVFSYLTKRITDKNAVEDIFQSVFVKFHKSRMLFDSKYSVLQWIYTITRSEMLDALKKKKLIEVEFKEEVLLESNQSNETELCIDSVQGLTDKEKSAINMRYYSELDFKEISEILKTSETNSRKIVSRGLQKIRKSLLGGSS